MARNRSPTAGIRIHGPSKHEISGSHFDNVGTGVELGIGSRINMKGGTFRNLDVAITGSPESLAISEVTMENCRENVALDSVGKLEASNNTLMSSEEAADRAKPRKQVFSRWTPPEVPPENAWKLEPKRR